MAFLFRFLLLLLAWLVLTGGSAHGWPAGVLAAAAAAWLSVRLLPPRPKRLRALPMLRLLADFVRGSLVGGFDVASRALHPRLRIHPGWVRHPLHLPPGAGRKTFGDMISLMPGTLPAGEVGPDMLVHCLDARGGAPGQIARSEQDFERVLGDEPRSDG